MIYPDLIGADGRVRLTDWRERASVKNPVGRCKACNGPLMGGEPEFNHLDRLTFLPCECVRCGQEFALPATRVLREPVTA